MARTKVKREVKYLNKDFAKIRDSLIEFSKTYFPNTYTDFNESDPGMMFIEMASYVGDVLSYYVDSQYKESLISLAEEKKSIFEISQALGRKPKLSSPSFVNLEVFQTVPAIGGASDVRPDFRYALNIPEGMKAKSNETEVEFRTLEDCNFKFSSSYDPMTVEIYETNANLPTKYLLKKEVKASSGKVTSEDFSIGNAEKYSKIILAENNVIDIISVVDSDGNNWYEVPFLAQDTVFEDVENNSSTDPALAQYNDTVPYLLKLLKTPRRFTTFIRSDDKTELRFGAGTSDNPDEEIIPNPDNVGSVLPGSPTYLTTAFDPTNFLNTKAYGLAPSNTTLTVTYSYGGSVDDNVRQGSLTNISEISYEIEDSLLDADTVQDAKNSVAINNPEPSSGGAGSEPIQEVKNNALAFFQAQSRAVTKEDYIVRTYSLPQKYGNIAKAYITQDTVLQLASGDKDVNVIHNPLALNLYVLGYQNGKKLTTLNQAVKENLKTYLSQFRMVTDAVNIKNAWIINIGVKFAVVTKKGYNKHEVVLRCIDKVKSYFNIDNWQINQPIVLSDLIYELSLVDGVVSVVPPEEDNPDKLPILITNKWKTADGYSGNIYDIISATKDGIIYPSLDPSIFEIKYPTTDIQGRVLGESSSNKVLQKDPDSDQPL